MKSLFVLGSLFLIATLSACVSDPVVLTDPEIVKVEKLVRVQVPGALLLPCQMAALPNHGDTWQDAFEVMKQKHDEQGACNKRFELIKEWQQGQ